MKSYQNIENFSKVDTETGGSEAEETAREEKNEPKSSLPKISASQGTYISAYRDQRAVTMNT